MRGTCSLLDVLHEGEEGRERRGKESQGGSGRRWSTEGGGGTGKERALEREHQERERQGSQGVCELPLHAARGHIGMKLCMISS